MNSTLKLTFILIIPFIIGISGCSGTSTEDQTVAETDNNYITITKAQFNEEKMELGLPQLHSFEKLINTNGQLHAAPDGLAEVNTHIPGMINSISVCIGQKVKKGQLLCSIEGNEVIMLQQDYKETTAKLKALTADYNRMKTLSEENIASQKDFMQIESEFMSVQAKHEGLRARLVLLNLNPEKIAIGHISSKIDMLAPIDGYIASQNCTLGQFVDPQQMLMEIVDLGKLHLQFYIYEKDVLKLKTNQVIRFYAPAASEHVFDAQLVQVGKSIDPETKTIECIGEINKNDAAYFVNGMYMMVEILIDHFDSQALPEEAILESESHQFVLAYEKEDDVNYYFKKLPVKTGMKQNGLVQIDPLQSKNNILLKGLYNLMF